MNFQPVKRRATLFTETERTNVRANIARGCLWAFAEAAAAVEATVRWMVR